MAVVFNGTSFELNLSQKPAAFTVPVVSKITGEEWTSTKRTLTLLKSTIEKATTALTMADIFDNVTIGLDKQINDILDADYIATQTVTSHAELIGLTTNINGLSGDDTWLVNTAVSYVATVNIFVLAV